MTDITTKLATVLHPPVFSPGYKKGPGVPRWANPQKCYKKEAAGSFRLLLRLDRGIRRKEAMG